MALCLSRPGTIATLLRRLYVAIEAELAREGKRSLLHRLAAALRSTVPRSCDHDCSIMLGHLAACALLLGQSASGLTSPLAVHLGEWIAAPALPRDVRFALRDLAAALQDGSAPEDVLTMVLAGERSLRSHCGLFFTPEPLVRYVVRSVDLLIRSRLGKSAGLADRSIRLLDPAGGSMAFIAEAWRQALSSYRGRRRDVRSLVRGHLLPHFEALELLPAPFLAGHVVLQRFLEEVGAPLCLDERIRFFLADALRFENADLSGGPFSEDARAARLLIGEESFSVILGNPPWSGHSRNQSSWISELLRGYTLPDGRSNPGYYQVDGAPLGERNPKWLQDDCVKFLRLAEWKIDLNGEGVVGFVVSHTCLEAPTFRGLRQSLLTTFDEIYALDLHGNTRRRERRPDGEPDENVFPGVAQGAAVLLLVKKPGLRKRVFRADLFGSRSEKLAYLAEGHVERTVWQDVAPRRSAYLFAKGDRGAEQEFRRGISLPEIFPLSSTGVITGRDALLTALDRQTFEDRVDALLQGTSTLKESEAAALREDRRWRERLTSFLVRPFDLRHLFYAQYLVARSRSAVMGHLLGRRNLALIVSRQSKEVWGALVSRWITGHKAVGAYDVNSVFPLYRFSEEGDARPNLSAALWDHLGERYGARPEPEALLSYLYALFYSPAYRSRYRALLAREFPRVLFPREAEAFARIASIGKELVALHLLADDPLRESAISCGGDPDQPLGISAETLLDYRKEIGRLYVGGERLWFEGIAPEVFGYRIGAYQVLASWLRARAGRVLGWQECREFRRIAAALQGTVVLEGTLAKHYKEGELTGF